VLASFSFETALYTSFISIKGYTVLHFPTVMAAMELM